MIGGNKGRTSKENSLTTDGTYSSCRSFSHFELFERCDEAVGALGLDMIEKSLMWKYQ